MGVLAVESVMDSNRTEEAFVENDLKDKRKKRRPRKSKQPSSASGHESEARGDASYIQKEGSSSSHVVSNGHDQLPKEYDHVLSNGHRQEPQEHIVHSSLIPSVNVSEHTADECLQNQQLLPHEPEGAVAVSVKTIGPIIVARPVDYARRKCFPPHLSLDAVDKALENGKLLRALFRVNAHNRLEAYCKIDGVSTDVLINGVVAQNRAIEGDTVAIAIDNPSLWPKMKGSNETLNNSATHNNGHEAVLHLPDCSIVGNKLHRESDSVLSSNGENAPEEGTCHDNDTLYETMPENGFMGDVVDNGYPQSCQYFGNTFDSLSLLEKLCILTSQFPSKRPTGRVVAIIGKSIRRDRVIGFLCVKQWIHSRDIRKRNSRKNKPHSDLNNGYVLLSPSDPKFTKMMVPVRDLPESIQERLVAGDATIESDLVSAAVLDWAEESHIPDACVTQIFGRGSDVEAQLAAILFENAIDSSEFSSEVLSCIPRVPWEVPRDELQQRMDLRKSCVFTIDPASATDLDDALSVEMLSKGVFRVGVHIADVSYFVLPDSPMDIDAQVRSTTVYLLQRKLPMLPPMLSDNLASLNPGVDRLAFSIFWDINSAGEVLDHCFSRTIIQSCCKLSYEHAQEIIDGTFGFTDPIRRPKLSGQSKWPDVIKSVKNLHKISKVLRENRFKGGALSLESPKIVFLFDEEGMPYDSVLSGRQDSNFLVEEFMLLANRTAAEVITRAYPSCALLRRHPEPNARKLQEFECFCYKHGLKLDASSSANLCQSLDRIKGELKNDSVLFDILMSYAARPMQLASYFCSGDSKDNTDLSHYALAVPLYTHFTSPLRRYPDIVVHRTLAAALEAEDVYLKRKSNGEILNRWLTGLQFNKDEVECIEAQEALEAAGLKHRVPGAETLSDVAAHCNEKKLAARHVKDATDKLCMWALLKKKEILFTEARVLGLGPRFMSIYIPKLAIERRIYYDDVEGLTVQWLEATSTLMVCQSSSKRSGRRSSPGKCKVIEEVALIVNPANPNLLAKSSDQIDGENGNQERCGDMMSCEPTFFPLTIRLLQTIPVALHAIGGDDGPLDIVARFYISSYFQTLQE